MNIVEFEKRINKDAPNGCWLWMWGKNSKGYGYTGPMGKTRGAHRVSYELYKGEIPHGMLVCHKCDNPSCVNPEHLFVGTQSDNIMDASSKGRLFIMRGSSHPGSKLTEKDVIEMRRLRSSGVMGKDLAARFGVCLRLVWQIVHREKWAHV